MPNFKRGDVVLVSFPTEVYGNVETKRRPAVVVSSDEIISELDDVLVVPILPTNGNARSFSIEVSTHTADGKAAGLEIDSVIECTVIATIPKMLLIERLGHFPPAVMRRVDEALAAAIGVHGIGGDYQAAGVPRKPLRPEDDAAIALPLPEPDDSDDFSQT